MKEENKRRQNKWINKRETVNLIKRTKQTKYKSVNKQKNIEKIKKEENKRGKQEASKQVNQ